MESKNVIALFKARLRAIPSLEKNIETNDTTNMINTLLTWEDGPEARFCHPREEHLIPLHVAAASAGPNANGKMIYDNVLMGVKVASFMFE